MADMQQLENAFLKAHKAGDKKAAGVLAAEIKRQRASGSSDAPVSGMFDQFVSGLDQPLEDIGVTMEMTGMPDSGKAVRDFTSKPANFVSASSRVANPAPGDSYVDPLFGIGWGNVPGAVVEHAGGYAGLLASRAAGGAVGGMATKSPYGAVAGAMAGPALFSFARQLGPSVLEIAKNDNRGPDELTWQDWAQAAATAGVSGALDAIGIGKIGVLNNTVKEVGKKTATEVVKNTAKETGKKVIQEGVTEAGQSVVEQFGTSVGTEKGAKVDLKEAFAEGIIGSAAGGTIDATRNAKPTFDTVMDIRSVDSVMRNDPDAQVQAEITDKVNNIADRMAGAGKAPVAKEINESVKHLKDQIVEVLNNQNLSAEDKTALKKALNTANGMDEADVDAIAGRSENPSEIKALVRKIQVVREMTVQRQTAKGFRGAVADTSYQGGAPLGAWLGEMTGIGAAAGSYIGDRIGTDISRRLKGNQTQGNAIDSLIGKKQARRAAMLLDRYGPSEATTALNTLSEKAAANKAQSEAEAQAQKDFKETMDRIRYRNSMREKSLKAEESAKSREERDKLKAERTRLDLETRQTRLQNITYQAMGRKARAEQILQKLEAEKSLNSLQIEMAQAKKDLQQHMTEQKAAESKDKADGRALDLQGKIVKLAKDIEIRNEAVKRAKISTARAEKIANRVPEAVPKAELLARRAKQKYDKLTSAQIADVKTDSYGNPIGDTARYQQGAEYIIRMESEGLLNAASYGDKAMGNRFIEAINKLHAYKGPKNQERRMAIYRDLVSEIDQNDLDAQRFIVTYIVPLAFAFDGREGQGGTNTGPGEDPPF